MLPAPEGFQSACLQTPSCVDASQLLAKGRLCPRPGWPSAWGSVWRLQGLWPTTCVDPADAASVK
eukprot:5118115-Alexandrium_andersonii.AAC.1